jgi:hypothetical protein
LGYFSGGVGSAAERHGGITYQLRPHISASQSVNRISQLPDSEEEFMPLVLTTKAQKLMKLCEIEGYANPLDLAQVVICDSVSPAICMTEGCDHTAEMEPDQREGYCEACGGNTMVSALVLAGLI